MKQTAQRMKGKFAKICSEINYSTIISISLSGSTWRMIFAFDESYICSVFF